LHYINLSFSLIFTLEAAIKITALGFGVYFDSGWNKFDFCVVCISVFDIVMDFSGNKIFSFLKIGPQIARVFRILRVSRLFKLVKGLKGLQKKIQILLHTLPQMFNVSCLLLLIFFIFAVLGVFLFKDIKYGFAKSFFNTLQGTERDSPL